MRILFIERTNGGRRLLINLSLPGRDVEHEVFYASAPMPAIVIPPDIVVIEGYPGSGWAEGAKQLAQTTYPGSKVIFLGVRGQQGHGQGGKLLAVYEKTPRGQQLLNLKVAELAGFEDKSGDLTFDVIYEYKSLAKRAAA